MDKCNLSAQHQDCWLSTIWKHGQVWPNLFSVFCTGLGISLFATALLLLESHSICIH